jgi:penicillin-binding protein 2
VVAGAFLLLVGAFFRTQVIQHEKFELRAENYRLRPVPLVAPRGTIYDRQGRVIAENVPGYSVKLIATSLDSLEVALRRLDAVVPLDSGVVDDVIDHYLAVPYVPVVVFGDAPFGVVARLEEHRAALPGLVIQAEPKRLYPAGKAAAHLVGYVAEVTKAELEGDRFPGARPGTIVGKAGLEREYDKILRGIEGVRSVEVNARGRVVREAISSTLPPVSGKPIRTTIDLDLQRFVDSIWPAGVSGAMVALTPEGEVLALYSAPTYDPNQFLGGIPRALWRQLNTDEARPLYDRAIQARYPPASTFKLAIAAMALKRGIITPSTRMPQPCTGGYRLGNRVFHCWKKDGHGNVDLIGAITGSCDIYFYQLGLKLGLDAILQDGTEMGFRSRTGVDLGSESRPIFPANTGYFDRLYGRNWSAPATTLNFSIGQGENTQTLLNMVSFYQALASDGIKRPPHIVAANDSVESRSLGLSAEALEGLRYALREVVRHGTAGRSYHQDLETAGKTGTAQNPHGDDHGWYIGFAPADHPQIIVGGMMEFAKHGTVVAPYVVAALRRYLLGSKTPAAPAPKGAPAPPADPAEDTPPDSSAPPPAVPTGLDSTGGGD